MANDFFRMDSRTKFSALSFPLIRAFKLTRLRLLSEVMIIVLSTDTTHTAMAAYSTEDTVLIGTLLGMPFNIKPTLP